MGSSPVLADLDLFDRAWEGADTVNLVLSEMELDKETK